MRVRQLGETELHITPIGFGSWAVGGGSWKFGWGPRNDGESIAAIRRALDLGMNWIDTAAIHRLDRSEEIVARAIKGRAKSPYIFTKCSMTWDENGRIHRSLKASSIRRGIENSLHRLQVDVIDLYQIHWPDPEAQIEEGWATLAELKREGKVRFIGVSNFNVEQMRRIMAIAKIDTLQPSYSLIRPEVERMILPYCLEHRIGVIVYSPMVSGFLSGAVTREIVAGFAEDDRHRHDPDFQEPMLSRNLNLAGKLKEIGERHGRSAGEVAIAWTLRHPAVTGAIVGARGPSQVDDLIGSAYFRLNAGEINEIEEFQRAHNPAGMDRVADSRIARI